MQDALPKTDTKQDILLSRDFDQLLNETARHWDCQTSLSVTPEDAKVSKKLGIQISFILTEAVANAVRHGGANQVDVLMRKQECELDIEIRDNGCGFAGPPAKYEHRDLVLLNIGPASLRDRISELGGSLTLSSSLAGVELKLSVPLMNAN